MNLLAGLLVAIPATALMIILLASMQTLIDWLDEVERRRAERRRLIKKAKLYTAAAAMQFDETEQAYFQALALNLEYQAKGAKNEH